MIQTNDPMSLYFTNKKPSQLAISKVTRPHTRQDTQTSSNLSSSQQSSRQKSVRNNRRPLTTKNQSISLHVDTDEGGCVKRINQYSSINTKMEKFTMHKKHIQHLNFYEGVYLIGSSHGKPKILFRYGSNKFDQLIPDMLFPHGVEDQQKSLTDSMSEINTILYKRHSADDNNDCFVIPIKIPQSFEMKASIKNNSNNLTYCVCMRVQDIIYNKKGYIVSEKILCIISFLPLFRYFFDFLIDVLNCAKQEKLKDISLLEYMRNCTLFEALPISVPTQEISPIQYEFNNIHLRSLKILANSIYVAQIVLNLLLEKSLIFLGDTVIQLGSILMLFLNHINWLHQLVASIPIYNLDILNVPVPLLGGMVIDFEDSEALVAEYPHIVFVDLKRTKIINSQDYSKSVLYIQLVKLLYGKHYEQIGLIIRKFQADILSYKQDDLVMVQLKQTQLWHNHNIQ